MTTPTFALLRSAIALAAVALAGAAQAAPAVRPNGYTWGELALLPEYCRYVQGTLPAAGEGDPSNPTANAKHWLGIFGEDFWNLHHYCRAMNEVRQSQEAGLAQARKKLFQLKAESDFQYIFNTCSPSLPIMPEVLLKYGDLELVMGNLPEASDAFERSRTIKPDYWPAYTRWVDVLLSLKQYERAKQLTEEGLKHAPNNPELLRRQAALAAGARAAAAPRRGAVARAESASEPR